jgi:hypothetical protein
VGNTAAESSSVDKLDNTGSTIICANCKNILCEPHHSKWNKCSICANFHICTPCWKNDFHKEHMIYIQNYTPPADPSLPHCSGCGCTFDSSLQEAVVHSCSLMQCKDYTHCENCDYWGMHWHHKRHLVTKPMSVYLNT